MHVRCRLLLLGRRLLCHSRSVPMHTPCLFSGPAWSPQSCVPWSSEVPPLRPVMPSSLPWGCLGLTVHWRPQQPHGRRSSCRPLQCRACAIMHRLSRPGRRWQQSCVPGALAAHLHRAAHVRTTHRLHSCLPGIAVRYAHLCWRSGCI
jgi:hypothetical protein